MFYTYFAQKVERYTDLYNLFLQHHFNLKKNHLEYNLNVYFVLESFGI